MASRLSEQKINEIKKLRSMGWSLNEIKAKLHIGHGTTFRYIKGVEINPNYKTKWRGKRGGSLKRMLVAKEQAYNKAKEALPALSNTERLIVLSCLYWAEGSKKDFSFTNTDPEMVGVFVDALGSLGISKDKLAVTIRVYEDLDKDRCIKYWAKIIDIAPEKVMNVNIVKGKKSGKLKYGMCRIRLVKGGDMLKYLVAIRKRLVALF